ncbi:MAG TPA: aldo/keto reductase [Cyclobacteriaceae bacterium]
MNYKKLGKSEIEVSTIAFGCMSLGNDDAENKHLLLDAFDQGINFFDTADIYAGGQNELTIGKAFKEIRDKVIIATKVGNQERPDGNGLDWNPTKKYILEAVEKSLNRLQTDYIDLYQLHGGTIDDPIDETIEAFEILKQQGKVRAYGISSIRPNVIREYVKRSHIDTVMMQFSLLDRRPEESCLDLLYRNNISVLVRGSLAQGLLINKPSKNYLNRSEEEVIKASEAIKSLKDRTPQEVAIQFALQPPAITSLAIGIRSGNQLKEILQAADTSALTMKEIIHLQENVQPHYYEQHR